MKASKTTDSLQRPESDRKVGLGSVEQFEAAATAILAEVAEGRIAAAQMQIIQEELPVVMEHRQLARDGMSRMLKRISEVRENGVPAPAAPVDKPAAQAASSKPPAQKPPPKAAKPEPADGRPATGGKKKKKVSVNGNTASTKNVDGQIVSITLTAEQKERYRPLTCRDLIIALANDFGTDHEFETAQARCFFELLGKGKPPSQLTMMKKAGELINIGRSKWKLGDGVEMKGGKDEE